jgi:hypothetical protein
MNNRTWRGAAAALIAGLGLATASGAYAALPNGGPAGPAPAAPAAEAGPAQRPRAIAAHPELRAFQAGPAAPGGAAPPAYGGDVRVSADNPGAPHNEFFGAADPLNPLRFITGANDYALDNSTFSGFWRSTDGGATWAGGSLRGPYPGGAGIIPGGDPVGAIDALSPTQNTYFGDLGYNASNNCVGGAYAHRSTDGGVTFVTTTQVAASGSARFIDKPWMAVNTEAAGPYAGRVYYTYTDFAIGAGCNFGQAGSATVTAKYSTNQGATWSAAVPLPQPGGPASSSGTSIAVGSGGTVYVGYNFVNTGADQRNYVTRSTDGGVTWGPYHAVTAGVIAQVGYANAGGQYYKADDVGHGFRTNQFPSIAVSPVDNNQVYMTWNHSQAGWDTTYSARCCGGGATVRVFKAGDIAFARSTDGGATWSAPARVNDDPLNDARDQFMPALTVSADGVIHLAWNDRRDDPNNVLYQTYYSQSTDGGLTWSANQRVSDAPSNPAAVLFSDNNGFIGDYNGIAANPSRVLPFWTDARAGTPANEQREYTDPGLLPPAPTATPRPCGSFLDVTPADYFYAAVQYLGCRNVISGYGDGTFRPYAATTRAQMVKIVVAGFGLPGYTPPNGGAFADVPAGAPFSAYIESAAHANVVSGYACGGPGEPCDAQNRPYFRPDAGVTRGQLAKIVVVASGAPVINPADATFQDVPPGTAFYTFVETAAARNLVSGYACGAASEPCGATGKPYFRQFNGATRGQIAKIVYNAIGGAR